MLICSCAMAVMTVATVRSASFVSATGRGRPECPFLCSLCASRCQVVFEDDHRYAIANAIDLLSKKKKKVGGGEANQREEKGLAVVSRGLANGLENNLVYESQMRNGRLDDKLMQDAKTNSTLDSLQNPMHTIDLSLRRKLSKEITSTSYVQLRVGSGATVEAVGGAAAMTDGAATAGRAVQVRSIQQAHRALKERAKGGARKAGDMTPSNTTFSKSAGSHHRFS